MLEGVEGRKEGLCTSYTLCVGVNRLFVELNGGKRVIHAAKTDLKRKTKRKSVCVTLEKAFSVTRFHLPYGLVVVYDVW